MKTVKTKQGKPSENENDGLGTGRGGAVGRGMPGGKREGGSPSATLNIDVTISMRENFAEVTAGAQAFVHSSNSNDQMFVVNFNEGRVAGACPRMRSSDSVEQLGGAIWGSTRGWHDGALRRDHRGAEAPAARHQRQESSDCHQRWRR